MVFEQWIHPNLGTGNQNLYRYKKSKKIINNDPKNEKNHQNHRNAHLRAQARARVPKTCAEMPARAPIHLRLEDFNYYS